MEKNLKTIEQRTVTFYDDEVIAVLVDRGDGQQVYVPVRPICEFLGVTWSPQLRRINRDPILSEVASSVTVTVTEAGQRGKMLCLPLDYLNGWLFGINANRVKKEVRERLLQYQRECYKVLAEAFKEGRLTTDPILDDLLQTDSEAVRAYKMLQEMVKLARNQIYLEAQVQTHTVQLADLERRLEEVESTLGDSGRHVTPDQASQLSQAVKTVAMKLSKISRRNEYGGVYGELYRKYGITSYKQLPANKFDEALRWLNEWRENIEGDTPF